jgi:phosphoenolpyruvate carboxylase
MVRKRKVDRPLRRDVRYLGRLLGEVLVEQEGPELFELEERVRRLAIERRRGPRAGRAEAERELAQLLSELPIELTEPVIRAFASYFSLVNLAEQHHRIRRARAHALEQHTPPQRGSLAAVLRTAKAAGVPAEKVRDVLAALEVTLTLTAHPTQAARRTVLDKLDRIARVLEDRDRCELTPHEKLDVHTRIREEIGALWQTDEVRRERPAVGDEVKNVVW